MVRIVICAGQKTAGLRLREAIDAYAASRGVANLSCLVISSRDEFSALLTRLRPDYFNIAICNMDRSCSDMGTAEVSETAARMHELAPQTRFVFISADEEHASCAYDAGGQFLAAPIELGEFERVIGGAIEAARRSQRHTLAVKSGKTVVNLNLDDVSFVEAGKKGPVIHLPDSTVLVTRTTLQALFERLSQAEASFMKVGGSFIVNLENMRTASEASAIFGDGETIILPTRLRKPVAEALRAHRLRA